MWGELVGLVGENGSGKSTLMQIVVGLLKRDAGEVERPAKLGYCPQLPMVWEMLTVGEHFQLFGRAYGLDEEATDRTEEALLDELQFARYRDFRIEELSGGTRQKLNLALAMGILIVSHLLAERERLDRIYSLIDGRTVFE